MTKHTPGPWHVDGFHMSAVIVHIGDTWKRVAETDSEGFRNPNWRADARLIAAAPELLDALKTFNRIISVLDEFHHADEWPFAIQAARAAIAKAEGSPPSEKEG